MVSKHKEILENYQKKYEEEKKRNERLEERLKRVSAALTIGLEG